MKPILEVDKLCAGYGRSRVLFDLGFRAPETGAIAVLGRNGVGKTTLLKTLAGELRAMSGQIAFGGTDITRTATEGRVRA
ncbi:MAG: ATP-binding cassette domain-containing protein, partial [Gammaproteobacteria bacterium]